MAKVYCTPKEVGNPPGYDHKLSWDEWKKIEDAWIEKIVDWCKKQNPNDEYVGVEVGFPMGDGHARYLVYSSKPLKLIWLPLGDAWQVPTYTTRGFNLSDLKRQTKQTKFLRELFDKKKGELNG